MLDPTGQLLRDLERRVEALERRRQLAARSVQLSDLVTEPWRIIGDPGQPAFQGSWAWYGAPWVKPSFALIGGLVHMRGLLGVGPGGGITIFTLPAGYRPGGVLLLPIKTHLTTGRINIGASGGVDWDTGDAGFNTYASLDSIPPFYPEG